MLKRLIGLICICKLVFAKKIMNAFLKSNHYIIINFLVIFLHTVGVVIDTKIALKNSCSFLMI